MADFDLDSYFAKRIGSVQPEPVNSLIPNPVNEIPQVDKIAELMRASAQKLDGLEKYKARVAAQEKANEASLVGQLGLDPEGTVGTGVNLVARGLAGASKNVIGQLLAVPSSVKASIHELGLDEEDRQAYVRHTQGVATPEDMARLSFKGQARDASTKLEMFQKADQSTEIAKDIRDTFNIDYLTHKANTDQLNADLGEGFQGNWDQVKEGWSTLTEGKGTSKGLSELASGLGGLIYKAGEAGATNPLAVTEYIAENLPQMFMGGAGKMGAALLMETNAGYAYENYEKGIAQYREKNNGAFPPEAERQKMAAYAASLALAEQLGDITAIKGMFPAKAVKGVAEAADAVTTGFKKGLLNTLNAGAKSLAVESGTEGWQTFAEGEATLKPATPEEIYTGASIGGLTGGSMSGGARGVAELLKATPEHAKLKNLDADKAKALDEAIASGDVTGYTNTKSKDYAPERAVAALFGNSQLDTTTPEAKQENLAKASKIIADLEERKTGMQTSLDELSPTAVEGYKAQLEVIKEKQKQVDPANTQEVAELSSTASFYEGLIKDAGSKLPKQLEASMSKLDTQLEESRTSLEQLKLLLQPKDVEVEALVQEIQEAPSKDALAAGSAPRAEAAVGVINLSMQTPDRLDPTTATELADNQENALTAPQRAYLRAFSAARIAENILKDMGQVSQEIFSGSPTGKKGTKYVGIAQYRARMAEAMSTLNREAADRFLGGLTKFMSDHQAKLSAAEQALAKGLGNQIVKANGEWIVSPERLSDAKIKEGGGLTVNSPGLVANIRAETDALVKAQAEMAAAYDLTFKKEPEKSVVQSAPAEKKAEPVKNTSSEKILEVKPRLQEEPVDSPLEAPPSKVEEEKTVKVTENLAIEKALSQVNRAYRRITRENPRSLWSALKHSLTTSDLNEIYGSDWRKRYTLLKGNPGRSLVDVVANGSLDEFLPHAMRVGINQDNEQDATEFIREKLRSGNYLTEETNNLLAQVSLTIQELEQALSIEDIQDAITTIEAEITAQEANSSKEVTTTPIEKSTQSAEESSGNQTQEVEAEAEESVEATTPVVESGSLSALQNKSPEGTAYHLANLLGTYFKQALNRDGNTSVRPLVAAKDFISSLVNKTTTVGEFLADKTLNDQQKSAVRSFVKHAREWQARIKANLPALAPQEYRHQDMMQFLLEEQSDGSVDVAENVKTAMAYAAYSWAAEQASAPRRLTDKAINAVLGRQKGTRISAMAYKLLGTAGTYQHNVVDSLGGKVLDALGLEANKDTPQNVIAQLRAALGGHTLKLLEDEGLATRTTISGWDIQALREEGLSENQVERLRAQSQGVNHHLAHTFFAVARDGKGKLMEKVTAISEANKGTKAVLSKLFQVESGHKVPSLEPVTQVQNTTSGTNQGLPTELKKILLANQARPRVLRKDKLALFDGFNDADRNAMLGVVEIDDATTHIVNRSGTQAKNEGLIREYDLFIEFVGEYLATSDKGLDTQFFLEFSAWKQQRVGIATNVANPQASKIVRFLIGSPDWTTKIESTNEELMNSFWLRVAEGLSIKTERADNAVSIEEVQAQLEASVYADAIQALRKKVVRNEALTTEEQSSIVAAVVKGGANLHTLDALIGVARQQEAKAGNEGNYTFTVEMMGEVDGVANGTMLNHVLMGAGPSVADLNTMLNQGGFYQEGSDHTQYNQWRGAEGNLDIYESTGRKVFNAVKQFVAESTSDVGQKVNSIWAIAGNIYDESTDSVTKDGRNLVKDGMNPLAFGSSLSSVINGMSEGFLSSVYGGFEKLAKNPATTQVQVDAYVTHINTLVKGTGELLPVGRSLAWYMGNSMKPSTEIALKTAFASTVGSVTSNVLGEEFSLFIARRNALNKTAQATFGLYDAVYQGMRESLIEELMAEGKLPVNAKGKRIGDLSKAQEAELEKRLQGLAPNIRTAMSMKDRGTRTGLRMAKTKRKQNQDPIYTNVTKYGTPLSTGDKSAKLKGQSTQMESPGVAMGSATTHSLDSAVSHRTQAALDVLNIHDAVGSGVAGLKEAARLMNKNTWEVLRDYSPLGEVYTSLASVVQGVAQMMENGELSVQATQRVQAFLNKQREASEASSNKEALTILLENAKYIAYQADSMKLGTMATWISVDQYAYQGGNYEVTAADREAVVKKMEALSQDVSAEVLDAIKTMAILVKKSPESGVVVTPEVSSDMTESVDTVEDENTPDNSDTLDPELKDMDVLGFPAVQAMQLLEHASQDTTLSEDLRTQVDEVLIQMMTASQSLKEAVLKVLKPADAAAMVQLLSKRFSALPANQWGEQGQSAIQSDTALVEFFESNAYVTADRVIQMLYQTISKGANNNIKEFNLKLLKVLFKTVNPKMVIRYVTPATEPSMVLEGADKSRGWYVSKGGKSEIYVLSPIYKHSGLTVETLIHELVHAAISQSIEAATGEAKELVDELGTLLERARVHVNQAGLKGYGAALANVQELVAWGMSNLDFQKNVLNQITVETKTGSNTLVSGMKKFIDTMVGLLFRGSKKSEQQVASNGMSVLIANVSGLFAEAAKSNTAVDMVLNQESRSPLDDVINYSTTDIYTALRQASGTPLDSSFDEHLRGVLGNIVAKLHGPFDDFKKQVMKTQALGPMDIWLKALDTGVAPFASQALASGFKIPAQVAFVMEQVEVTIKAALENNEAYTKTAYKELSDLYTEVSARLQPKDFHDGPWATATANEQAIATELYNFIFKVEQTNGKKSDYLARFAALGLTHPHLNKLLQVPTAVKVAGPAKTFAERLQSLFEKVLGFFSNKIAHTYEGQPADEKLLSMVGQLVDIEAKHRQQIASRAAESNYVAPVEEAVKAAAEAVRSKVGQLASNPFLRNHKSGYVRGASAVVSTLANDRVEAFMEGLAQFRNENFKGKLGIAAGLLNDMKGPVQDFLKLLLESKSNERTRKSIITNAAKGALAAFVEGGKALTPKAKASLSAVFLRTGAHALVDHFTMADLEQLVSDKARRTKEIQDWEAKLAGFNTKHQNYFKYQAKALAYYKAVGKSTSEILMLNAHAIVNMYGTVGQTQITQAEAKQAEGIVDVLVSLYALEYSDSVHLSQAAQVLRAENARGTENGVEFLLKLHKKLEAESEARLFRGNRTLMVKGYTPEIFNPYVDLKIVEEGSEESKDLIDQGYALGDAVPRDPSDPGTAPRRIHVLRGKGLQPHVTGVISYSGNKAKGSPQHNGYLNVNTQSGAMNASMNAEFMNNKALGISQMFANNPGFDPRKTSANFAVPLLNERGEVVNWRYMMTESSKDVLLERTNDFDKIIGTLAGSIYDKQTTEEHNEKAIAALREDYLAGYAKNQKAYVLVGPKSTDPEMREIWALLPDATKADARKIWGYDGMMVRLDSLDVMFGYRKLSIASFLNNDAETLEGVQKIMREWFGVYARSRGMNDREADNYAKKLGLMVTKGERVWQEIVRETKDLIVVKTGTVMLGNIWSNMSYLVLSGVSMKDIVHHHIVALKGATAYRKDSDELFRLKTLRDTGYTQGNDAEIAKNIARLEDALARNPVVELIDAGLMPTITEDIAQDEDAYSYKTGLVKKMDGITKKLNPAIVSGARTVYMAHDTRLYQGLSRVTQLSDFVARYTLYQHMTTRKTGPLTKEAAVIQASEAFINYDVPMHRGMQYMDDMGITPFMKYYLRIQKVLLKMGRENPARVMATLLLGNLWDLGPIVLEGSAFTRIGNNPLEAGAFNFPGALTDLATLSVFK